MLELLTSSVSDKILPYLVLGIAAMLEGPVTILVGGAAVSTGQLLPLPVFLVVVSGNLIADMGWYNLGRLSKLEWLERISSKTGVDPQNIEQLEKSVQENAPRMLFLSKLTVGLPIPTLIAIGLNRVAMKHWLIAWISGELLKSALLITVGYFSAEGIEQVFGSVKIVLWVITAVIVVTIVINMTRHKKARHSSL